MNRSVSYRTVLLGVVLIGLMACLAPAETITVGPTDDYDFRSIAGAVQAAGERDIILVADGHYMVDEEIYIRPCGLVIKSEHGPDDCVLDGEHRTRIFYINTADDVTIEGFTLTRGAGEYGGAMVLGDTSHVANCIFIDNHATSEDGGAIQLSGVFADGVVRHCTFIENHAADDGGALAMRTFYGQIVDCQFIRNTAGDNGGAIFAREQRAAIAGCSFLGNQAASNGGAIYFRQDYSRVANCVFSGNQAQEDGGALYVRQTGGVSIYNCTLSANAAQELGGGIATADSGGCVAGGCILWGNADRSGVTYAAQLTGLVEPLTASWVQFASDAEGAPLQEPMFVDADGPDDLPGTEDDDLHLLPQSPCIDGGDFDLAARMLVDRDGQSRVQGLNIDIGAYEHQPAGGTAPDFVAPEGTIVISEVLTHSPGHVSDWIELHNTTDERLNLAGYALGDGESQPYKFHFIEDTWIEPNGYLVLYEDTDFNRQGDPRCLVPFALGAGGDWLFLAHPQDWAVGGFQASVELPAAPSNVSLIRHENSNGQIAYLPSQENTPGQANAAPLIGPLVVSEIMFLAADLGEFSKYVELHNNSDMAVTLVGPSTACRVSGSWKSFELEFQPPAPTELPAHSYLLVAKDAAALRDYYPDIPAEVPIVEVPDSNLPDIGSISVEQREADSGRFLVTDYVLPFEYPLPCSTDISYPWPGGVRGTGMSLTRIDPAVYGDDPTNWQTAEPTPGR